MANRSNIAWTDATFRRSEQSGVLKKQKLVDLVHRWPATAGLQPVPHVAVFLRAIAGDARRHDVAWLGAPSEDHRDNVIPRRGASIAVGALAAEKVTQRFRRARWQRGYRPLSRVHTLSATSPEYGVGVVSSPLFGVCVWLANALPSHDIFRQPSLAATAPREAQAPHALPLWFRRIHNGEV